jgi:DNA polymerase III alpha subunit (gram-positive type)
MTWAAGPYMAIDTETTGVNVETDRIVTAAVVDIRPGEKPRTRTWILNPGVEIPAGATAIHGITTEQARTDGIHPSVALDEISLEVETALASGMPIVAMNAACRVLFRIAKQYPRSIGTADLNELHDKQVEWHAERQRDFAAYRERIGEPLTDISTDWPIRRPAEVAVA